MRSVRIVTASLAAALVAASAAFAAGSGSAAQAASLGRTAQRTVATGSLRFALTAQVVRLAAPPYVLHANGATSPAAAYVHVQVGDLRLPNGTVLAGPSADEETDGTFLYVRSTASRASVGDMWVRERLAALAPTAPELQMLHQLSPASILRALGRAQGVTGGGRVLHASLPYADPVVQGALAALEGGVEYQNLRLTAWVGPQGYLRTVVVTGRTADASARFLLTVSLRGYGQRVAVTPPPQGAFVDFNLSRLSV